MSDVGFESLLNIHLEILSKQEKREKMKGGIFLNQLYSEHRNPPDTISKDTYMLKIKGWREINHTHTQTVLW